MNFGLLLCALFSVLWLISQLSNVEPFVDLILINGVFQLLLFAVVACVPFLRTGRMTYVDIAWAVGVALIGALILVLAEGNTVRIIAVGSVYLFIGLRMGLGALTMAKTTGVIFKTEFPRYIYRKEMLEKTGEKHHRLHMLAEIMAQGFANMSVLAIPGFLIATNSAAAFSMWEIAGIAIWGVAYLLESTADAQKMLIISKHKRSDFNVGLWRYSRHPNYFAEWLVWTGLVVATVPSWWSQYSIESTIVWIALGVGSVGASAMLYITLVYLTGAIPSEYFSVQKRPDYARYQQTTNRFFPWFPKDL